MKLWRCLSLLALLDAAIPKPGVVAQILDDLSGEAELNPLPGCVSEREADR